ncbi:MAG: CotH kinase family protein [Bacteroidaceae bacterium]|nr:CotH kinase family protein [Bacteroidaceae bacterium]
MRPRKVVLLAFLVCPLVTMALGKKLTGTSIGTSRGYIYETEQNSTTQNLRANALDGDLNTYFASNRTSRGWVGLDLGETYVISRVGWAVAPLEGASERTLLGVFEGANQPDFSDALPLHIITAAHEAGKMHYANVAVSRSFRYVRYMGPADSRCNIADVEFWGYLSRGSDKQFYQLTNLPTVVIHTEDGVDPYSKEREVNAYVSIVSENGTHLLQDTATVRLRGNNSATHPKKPYRIKFDEKHRVLDSPAKAKKWTLINNYGDKTLMRNVLAFDLSRRFGIGFTPFCRPVDVILNGEYQGNYQLCDQIEVRKNRVDITEMDSTCTEGEALQGGYLLEVDAYATDEPRYFMSNKSIPVTVKYPDSDEITEAQFQYIRRYFNDFEKALYTPLTWKTDSAGYRRYINVPSLLRHLLVGELAGNTDTYWSTYLSKDRYETQFLVEPVWDFDLAFDNDNRTYPINNLTDYIYCTKGSSAGTFNSFVSRMTVTDTRTRTEMQDMWAYARRYQGITEEELLACVDSVAETLDESQRLNFVRWPIMKTKVHQNPVVWGSYEREVDNVKNYLRKRIVWLDRKLRYNPTEDVSSVDPMWALTPENVHLYGDKVYIFGMPDGTPYQFYTLNGILAGRGVTGVEGPRLSPGIYVLRCGEKSIKVKL